MATPHTNHPTDAQLADFSSGRLPAAECDEIETHLAECDTCCQFLKTLPDDTLVALLRQAQPETPRESGQNPESRHAGSSLSEAGGETVPPGMSPIQGEDSAQATLDQLPAGLREHPRYRIVSLLGRGGMGDVYLAEHRLMNRLVAIKVINPQLLRNSSAVERFQREVQAAAKLAHSNIVAAHDAEQAADTHFLVMEYVQGEDLSAIVRKFGGLPIPMACDYVRQAALGLEHARQRGMVHRDIKPQNLILTPSGQIKILDFGLAQFASESAEQSARTGTVPGASDNVVSKPGELTQAGAVMGTPDYMAPEQARDARSADIRTDIYSLGCTLYCLLTGRPPFNEGTVQGKIKAHLECEPISVAELREGLPSGLLSVLQKMMAKAPADRYQTPADVAAALASFAASGSELTQTPLPASAPTAIGRRSPSMSVVAAVLIGLAFLGVFGGLIVIGTDKGRIEIQSEVDDVDVVITQGGKEITVFDRQTGSQVKWLPSGMYEVQLKGNRNDIELSSRGFVLSRWGSKVVTLKHKASAAIVENPVARDSPQIGRHPAGAAPPTAVAPFEARQAKVHQTAWAKYLGIPVEYTNSVGMEFRWYTCC